MAAQAKLLLAIQDLAVERVGGHATRRLNVAAGGRHQQAPRQPGERGLFGPTCTTV